MSRGVQFTEEMKGWLSFDEADYNQALWRGRVNGSSAKLHLTIKITDLDRFAADRNALAAVEGRFECDELGGCLRVEKGTFQLFAREPDPLHVRMRYRLFLRDQVDRPLTLTGFKLVEDDPNFDSYRDVTTLFLRLFSGHLAENDETRERRVATGIVRLGPADVLREAFSFRGRARSRLSSALAVARYQFLFLRELARTYAGPTVPDGRPSFPRDRRRESNGSVTPWHEVPRQPGLEREIVCFHTQGEVELNLHHLRRGQIPHDAQPVLLSHGAGLRGQSFYGQPSGTSLADRLLAEGYDVWIQNWRGSIDFPPRDYTLDRVARYDHPATVDEVLARTEARQLKAIVHCQGSISFTMAAVAGLLPDVTHVVSNSVSLHVRVTPESRVKQLVMLPISDAVLPGADAQWGIRSPSLYANVFSAIAGLVRRDPECGNPVCSTASYMYGTGPDVLLRHADVAPDVHTWIGRELGYTPFRLIKQLVSSVGAKHVVPAERLPGMPASYVAQPPRTNAAFTFIVGSENRMFLPEGQQLSFAHFASHAPGRHRMCTLDGFGHLDTLVGKRTPEVFDRMMEGLER
jgi:hypothetical protein